MNGFSALLLVNADCQIQLGQWWFRLRLAGLYDDIWLNDEGFAMLEALHQPLLGFEQDRLEFAEEAVVIVVIFTWDAL